MKTLWVKWCLASTSEAPASKPAMSKVQLSNRKSSSPWSPSTPNKLWPTWWHCQRWATPVLGQVVLCLSLIFLVRDLPNLQFLMLLTTLLWRAIILWLRLNTLKCRSAASLEHLESFKDNSSRPMVSAWAEMKKSLPRTLTTTEFRYFFTIFGIDKDSS